MNWAAIVWLVFMVLFIMMESSTVTMVCIWFAVGSLVAMLVSLLGGQLWLQILVFLVVSGLFLALLRPFVRKFVKPRIIKTNVDAVVDSTGYVTQDIDNIAATGQVKLDAMYWTARSLSGENIPAGTLVKVERIEGVKALVSPVEVSAEVK